MDWMAEALIAFMAAPAQCPPTIALSQMQREHKCSLSQKQKRQSIAKAPAQKHETRISKRGVEAASSPTTVTASVPRAKVAAEAVPKQGVKSPRSDMPQIAEAVQCMRLDREAKADPYDHYVRKRDKLPVAESLQKLEMELAACGKGPVAIELFSG